jgi:hypothetical protein
MQVTGGGVRPIVPSAAIKVTEWVFSNRPTRHAVLAAGVGLGGSAAALAAIYGRGPWSFGTSSPPRFTLGYLSPNLSSDPAAMIRLIQ